MKTVYLVNLRPGRMDISCVRDVNGHPVALKPHGKPGYYRECPAEAEDHPDVVKLEKAGWLAVRYSSPDEKGPSPEELAAQKKYEEEQAAAAEAAKQAEEEAAAAEAAKQSEEEAAAAEAAKRAEEEAAGEGSPQ